MDLDNLIETYSANFVVNDMLTVGQEYELVVVSIEKNRYGHAATFEETSKLFKTILENGGWEPKDPKVEPIFSGLKTSNGANKDAKYATIDTEMGACTLEIGTIPTSSLDQLHHESNRILKDITEAAAKNNLAVLGYGIQPITIPSQGLIVPKPRYNILQNRFPTNDKITPYPTGAQCFTTTASSQTHLDVNRDDAYKAVNVVTAFTPALIALFGNSPIWGGKTSDYKSSREKFWEYGINHPRDKNRFGLAPYFNSIEHYIETILEFQPIMTKRDGIIYEFIKTESMRSYLEQGVATVKLVGSYDLTQIEPEMSDFLAHDGFVWLDARLKSMFGTVEQRCVDQQPQNELTTVPATFLGLVSNLDDADTYVNNNIDRSSLHLAKEQAMKYGLKADFRDYNILEVVGTMLGLAREGLQNNRHNSACLDPLDWRLAHRENPADKVLSVYQNGGIKALVEHTRLKVNP